VSAWASEQGLVLGQRCVDGKSNEITAVPELPLCANDDETLALCEFRLGRRRTASWLRPTFMRI